MKIIILGANGQLGLELTNILKNKYNLKAYRKEELDITDFQLVNKIIFDEKPKILINTAAYTSVENAEKNIDYAYKVNSEAVHNISKSLEINNGFLIHYSTDYVYEGTKKIAYKETDETYPLNIYGKSKLDGEKKIQESMSRFYILRTSWVVSYYGNNFIKTILRLIKNKKPLNIVRDQFGVPTSTTLLGEVTQQIVKNISTSNRLDSGIYNITPKGKTNWYQMANKILERAIVKDFLPELNKVKISHTNTINNLHKAKRPRNSLLDSGKIEKGLNIELPHWEYEFKKTIDKILDGSNHEKS